LVIGPIGQLVTAKSMPWRPDDEALVLEDAGLVINNGVITDLGPWEVVRSRYNASQVMNADGLLVTAGLIDPHTHLLFAGSREDEFELKVMGATYEDILKGGGGIYRTINDTIRAGDSELISIGLGRLNRALSHGTTTIEVKSGYGLTMEQEVRLLRLINELGRLSKVDVIPTFLAHVPPRSGRRDEYVRGVANSINGLRGLAKFVDVFCDEGAFTVDETRVVLKSAVEAGFGVRIHADELAYIGCSDLVRDFNFSSMDHLLNTPESNVKAMANKGVTATLLPITILTNRTSKRPPINALRGNRVPIAIGTDFSPNTWSLSLQLAMELSTHMLGLTPMEALMAATVNAAYSLGLRDRGLLMPGYLADVVIWNVPNYRWLTYELGMNKAKVVIKRGEVVVQYGD